LASSYYNYAGWKQGLPYIFYKSTANTILTESNIVKMKVAFSDPTTEGNGYVHTLKFQLASYYLNGTFIGFESLSDQLMVCPSSLGETEKFRKFGTSLTNECQLDVLKLISPNQHERPNNENLFYELYLEDYN
jgi:ribonucleotide reductase alpha subunit